MTLARFGRRVIGKEAADQEQKTVKENRHRFGPRVVGREKFEERRREVEAAGEGVGPVEAVLKANVKVGAGLIAEIGSLELLAEIEEKDSRTTIAKAVARRRAELAEIAAQQAAESGKAEDAEKTVDETADTDESGHTTIEELTAALEADPEVLDTAISAEFAREGGARQGALEALLAAEQAKDEPRDDVVNLLEQHIG